MGMWVRRLVLWGHRVGRMAVGSNGGWAHLNYKVLTNTAVK